jgi:hypothetical protein
MADLTQGRMAKPISFKSGSVVLAAAQTVYKGGVACIDPLANAFKKMAAGNNQLIPLGMFAEDATAPAMATGRVMVVLDQELWGQWLDNAGGGSAVTTSNLYSQCYAYDDHTVSNDSGGTNAIAGTVWDLDPLKGVFVVFNDIIGY